MTNHLIKWLFIKLSLCFLLIPGLVTAQNFPERSVRWVVPYPAGGGVDFMTRVLAEQLANQFGQSVVVDNKPGASGILGMELVANANPDGYTVLTGENGAITINPALFQKLPYDPIRSYRSVSLFAKNPFLLVINPSRVPVKSFPEFVNYVRANPGKVNYASFGSGSIAHVMMELFMSRANLNLLHVPYKGAAPAIADLLSGQVDAMFVDYSVAMTNVNAGKLRALAVTTKERHPSLPLLPSLQEAGVPDYDVFSWLGVMVPAKTPEPVIEALRGQVHRALASPVLVSKFSERGIIPTPSDEATMVRLIQNDIAVWTKIVRDAHITVN